MAQNFISSTAGSSAVQVVIYWAIVGLPLCWGVYKTVDKSKALFQESNVNMKLSASPAAMGGPPALPAATATPTVTDTPAAALAPTPAASPFSTAQPSATVAPIDTPVPPTT